MRSNFLKRWFELTLCVAVAQGIAACSGASDAPSEAPAGGGPADVSGGGEAASLGVAGSLTSTEAGGSSGAASPSASAGQSDTAGGSVAQGGNAASGAGGVGGNAVGGHGGAATGGTGGGTGGGAAGAANLGNVTVYIAGDSTVSEYKLDPSDPKSWAGWGQMLSPHYDARVKVVDAAVGGRTARRFIQEGSLAAILKTIRAGDYLLVQFGTNDSNTTAQYTIQNTQYPYFANAETDFKTYLQEYIDGALGKQAVPVLVTPPPRNSAYCNGARSLANYGQAMLELGQKDSVAVVDLGLKTHAYLKAICPKPATAAQEMFFKVTGNTIDGTHFQENGARIMAGFVADGIAEAKLPLSAYQKPL